MPCGIKIVQLKIVDLLSINQVHIKTILFNLEYKFKNCKKALKTPVKI